MAAEGHAFSVERVGDDDSMCAAARAAFVEAHKCVRRARFPHERMANWRTCVTSAVALGCTDTPCCARVLCAGVQLLLTLQSTPT